MMTRMEVDRQLIESLAGPREVEAFISHEVANRLVFQIRQYILGQQLYEGTTTYPTDWKEAVREAFYRWLGEDMRGHWPWLGDYLRKRRPVRYTTKRVDVQAIYPKISFPDREHRVVTFVSYP